MNKQTRLSGENMKVLNIEVIDMYVERFSKENYLEFCLTTTNGSYIATVNILGISDIDFWNEDYGVAGSPVWTESNVHDVIKYKLVHVYDDNENAITNPDIVSTVENVISTYDFYNTSEEIAEMLINEMRDSYDCDV